jgi:hypothetical protein
MVVSVAQRSQGSSVNIVSGYVLDDRVIEVRSPAEARNFFYSLCVQTSSGARPASCTVSTGGKARSDADHLPLSSAEVVND